MTYEELIKKISTISTKPGVYIWKDSAGNILYVGKAKNLRKRMQQYFRGSVNSYMTSTLVKNIDSYEIFIVRNNKEALLLEKQYIDKYNPPYNLLLLDDRRYPYIKIELQKKLNISLSRNLNKKENKHLFYFGPFPNGYGANVILKLLQREAFYEKGLVIKNNDYQFWLDKFNNIKSILKFNNVHYINELKNKMEQASELEQYEIALDLRNSINYLEKLREDQIIELKTFKNIDVIDFKYDDKTIYVTILFYRYGLLINKDNQQFSINGNLESTLENFIVKYYNSKLLPEQILVSNDFINLELNLPDEFKIINPKIGPLKRALEVARLNLDYFYENKMSSKNNDIEKIHALLTTLKKYVPNNSLESILIFDNSNINNTNPVGVAVAYINGVKNKDLYRKFNLSINVSRLADVEYMKQTFTRYFTNEKLKKDFDLIIVDGGKAQIKEAKKVLNNLNFNIPIIGLVKDGNHKTRAIVDLSLEEREIKEKELFNFLSEIQIEVDRFAKSHLRNRQKIISLEGKLQSIKGLGPALENKLLNKFKTYSNIYNASEEELSEIVPKAVAKEIKKRF
ncbi:excinuclease ABC subunit UvrC [Mycoplasma sp. Mirounga ES2805-ORL]|uniref:excinuclease ABC subunit UvrC n=1 Tax=Mycoplasma sp. Mirounga ES2805-ORL TaxID=754514 RepID=UPI00197B54D2|nr:excinuclease ABC subunit UvrC [Mycoplasma sp. Mirounga ES2805-ORL]QSF13965.1 excinuclease ABC subunit C [Mycoplasma sp. Mirounga ES2805-ORL]